jgi:D-3-phosphoglycerate dehydrogenase
MCSAEFFEAVRPGAIFINTSRAEVVDQAALLAAIHSKGVRAGLDVFEGEPAGAEGEVLSPLCNEPSVYCTHHIGASTDQAQEAVAAETVRIVKVFGETGQAPNVVN